MRSAIRKPDVIAATAAGLSGGTAGAQQFGGPAQPLITFFPGRPPSTGPPPLRARVQYKIQLPPTAPPRSTIRGARSRPDMRRSIALAERECGALVEAFDGDSRVVGPNVSNARQGFGPSGAMSLDATTTIEVAPRRPARPAPPAKPQ